MVYRSKFIVLCLLMAFLCFENIFGSLPASSIDLTQLSIEELMQIEVTSVSKKQERLFETAAAVFILTQEDLRRSGVCTIQDALRLVPGMQVGRIDANKWAISARGFNQIFSNKLLVMIDGRSVYSSIFSGVLWETQDIIIEDVERIEVIRGPGATLWGANAVNGVVNIITKHSDQTTGGAVYTVLGAQEIGPFGIRYGGTLKKNWFYRAYSQYFQRNPSMLRSRKRADDDWWLLKNGFRSDYQVTDQDAIMFSGEFYSGIVGQTIKPEFLDPASKTQYAHDLDVAGGNFMELWNHKVSSTSDFTLKMYYSCTRRDDPLMIGGLFQNIDLDYDYRWKISHRHSLVWGMGIRSTWDNFNNTSVVHFIPSSRRYNLYGVYIQDEITLLNRRLFATLGSKFEQDDLAGPELQPNFRIRWLPTSGLTLWGAISRAVRTPARTDQDFSLTRHLFSIDNSIYYLILRGSRNLPSESLISRELGLRTNPIPQLYFDCTGFYHAYQHLRTYSLGETYSENSDSTMIYYLPYIAGDNMAGHSYGFESFLEYQFNRVRIRATYAFFKLQLHPDENIENLRAVDAEGEVPRHQWTLQAFINLPWHLELDGVVRFVDELPAIQIESYLAADLRIGWNPSQNMEFSVIGQNLLQEQHLEFMESYIPFVSTEVSKQVMGRVSFKF